MTRQRAQTVGLVAATLLVGVVVLVARVALEARAGLNDAEAAEAAGRTWEATARYLDAARLYTPGAGPSHRAVERLQQLAVGSVRDGRPEDARRAFEAIRAAALGTRSLFVPYAAALAEANRQLAGLYALAETHQSEGAAFLARRAYHARKLEEIPGPSTMPVLLALAGLAVWIGASIGFFLRGLDRSLTLRRQPALATGLLFVIGMAMFLVGLRLA